MAIDPGVPGRRWLLIRRHRRTSEMAYYRCYCPRRVPLTVLAAAAGRRWMVAEHEDSWHASVNRMRALSPARVHFCHHTDVVHG